ncbi:YbaK/EbsC family protein [Dasania marina]|uniref:aminoacyl-tRNA deacylase n=1 Tax=Dasania marina TaxID=471499 RepID=UPI0030DC1A21
MPSKLLLDYLQRTGAQYQQVQHPLTFTAAQLAEYAHLNGSSLAKVTMVKLDNELAMVVLPASHTVHCDLLANALMVAKVEVAHEKDFGHRFPRCALGAIPPFGHLFGVTAYMMPIFDEYSSIAFNAGSHTEMIIMPFREYERVAHVDTVPRGVVPPSWSNVCELGSVHRRLLRSH